MRLAKLILGLCCLGAVLTLGCSPKDPRAEIIEQRARWQVQLLSFAQNPAGAVTLSTRISGPPNSTLSQMTVFFELKDAAGQQLGKRWHSFDLTDVPRGGPRDLLVSLPDPGGVVETVGIGMAVNPTPEEESNIPELQL